MARFRKPPDPRDNDLRPRRQRRFGGEGREPVPWLWLGLGIVVTIVGIGLALLLVNRLLAREPLATSLPTPTIIRLTAPPTVEPSPTVEQRVPTPIPTFTPAPTRDLSRPPETVTVGYYASVSGTGNAGLTLRGGPSTLTTSLLRAPEGTMMLVIGGPEEGGDFLWWQVRLLDGQEGWVAGQYLAPAPAPGTVSEEIEPPDNAPAESEEETPEAGTPEAP
jgi:hypothetical protein